MDELLNALTPAEFWLWGWLSSQYHKGKSEIISLGQALAPALYSRKQLTRILRSLELKKFLIIGDLPANHHQDLIVVIDKLRGLDIHVQVDGGLPRHSCPGGGPGMVFDPEKRVTKTPMSSKKNRDEPDLTGPLWPTWTPMSSQKCSASASARKALNLKALAGEKDQKQLLRSIFEASPGEREELAAELARIAPMARSKKLSRVAVLYGAVRFLQDGAGAKNPAAWVEAVAKKAQLQLMQFICKGGEAGETDGKGGVSDRQQMRSGVPHLSRRCTG